MALIDTHAHLDSFSRTGDLEAVLERAISLGVTTVIAIGTDLDDWDFNRAQSVLHPRQVYYTVGLHPCSVKENWAESVKQLEAFWLDENQIKPVALGECGLDRFHLPQDGQEAQKIFSWQQDAFKAQLQIANKLKCKLVIHARGAFYETMELIDASGVDWSNIVFHCFSEGAEEVKVLNAKGGRASFTGIITYKNADNVRAALLAQGIETLMVETDAPYLAPTPNRGKTNEPGWVSYTAQFAAALLGVSAQELAEITTRNAKSFYGLDLVN
jgi:TatD DNase family protein